MATRELTVNEFAILALLRLHGPMHGYQMARWFEQDLADVCPIEQSALYAYLKALEQREFVAWREARIGKAPPRKIFELRAAGEDEVDGWLRRPVERMREVKLDFLLKLYFLHLLDPAGEQCLLAAQVAACDAYRTRICERMEDATGFARLVLRSKMAAANATRDWLLAYQGELEMAGTAAAKEGEPL